MANMSLTKERGIVLESSFDPQPGSDILIRMENHQPDSPDFNGSKGYRAKVMWCKESLNEYTFSYIAGVRIIESF